MIDPLLKKALQASAKNNGITYEDARIAYFSVFEFIRDKVADIDMQNITESEFESTKTSFNLPFLGKISLGYDIMTRIKEASNKNEKI